MELSDRAEYGRGLTDEQRVELNARAAAEELQAVASSVAFPDRRDPPRYAMVRSACWLLLDSGDPCKAAKLARWACANGMRDYVRQALVEAEKRLGTNPRTIESVFR
jgi:hypothetical protein